MPPSDRGEKLGVLADFLKNMRQIPVGMPAPEAVASRARGGAGLAGSVRPSENDPHARILGALADGP